METLFLFLIMVAGGLVQAMSGFGLGLLCMSVLPYFMDYKIALPVLYVALAVTNVRLVMKTYGDIRWKLLLVPVAFSLLGRIAGMSLFSSFDATVLTGTLGALIIAISLLQLTCMKKIKLKPDMKNGAIAGILSGVLGGIAGSSGPPIILYYMNVGLSKNQYIATTQLTFLAGTLFSMAMMAACGNYTVSMLPLMAVASAGVLIGVYLGQKVFIAIKGDTLVKCINAVLLAMGISLLVKVF